MCSPTQMSPKPGASAGRAKRRINEGGARSPAQRDADAEMHEAVPSVRAESLVEA